MNKRHEQQLMLALRSTGGLLILISLATIGPYLSAAAAANAGPCFANGTDNYGNPIIIVVNCPTPAPPYGGSIFLLFGIIFVVIGFAGRDVSHTEQTASKFIDNVVTEDESAVCPHGIPVKETCFECNEHEVKLGEVVREDVGRVGVYRMVAPCPYGVIDPSTHEKHVCGLPEGHTGKHACETPTCHYNW
jgi:hypothetical protein